jgi:hypothetical protein
VDPRGVQAATAARWSGPLLWLIVVALSLTTGGLGWLWYQTRPARKAAVAQRMTDEGYAQWNRGDLRAAEISFQSAAQINPKNLRPKLLLGRMFLNTSQRERGRELFSQLLGDARDPLRTTLAANYHDALVCVGWWDELARLAISELATKRDGNQLWLDSALAALRLGGWDLDTAAQTPGWDRIDARSGALLRAQIALNHGDVAQARAILATVPGPFTPLLSISVARLHLRAGDSAGASVALAMTATPLTECELLLGEVLVLRHNPEMLRRAVDTLLADPTSLRAPGTAELLLGMLLLVPDRGIAERVSTTFATSPQTCSDALATALFVYCSLSGAEQATAIWSRVIEKRAGASPLRLPSGKLDKRTALFLINSFPLTRDLIVAVLDTIDETRARPTGVK